MLASRDRKLRFFTGYGLEGVLPDGKLGRILDREAIPRLQRGEPGEAIVAAMQAAAGEIAAEAGVELTGVAPRAPPAFDPAWRHFLLIALLILFLLLVTRAQRGSRATPLSTRALGRGTRRTRLRRVRRRLWGRRRLRRDGWLWRRRRRLRRGRRGPRLVSERASARKEESVMQQTGRGFTRHLAGLVLALLALASSGCGYNQLVSQSEAVDAGWSEVQNQLQRRNDLIPNLVNTVKGFAAQEQNVLVRVTEARSRVAGAGTPAETMEASNQLSGALSRLLVVVEKYPELKSDRNFIQLQDELAGTENRLAVARNRYNDAVREYNTTAKRFPTVLIAKLFGFAEKTYFEAPETAREVPPVQF